MEKSASYIFLPYSAPMEAYVNMLIRTFKAKNSVWYTKNYELKL